MVKSGYPRPGFCIAPASLREILDVPLLRQSYQKASDSRITKLCGPDERSWFLFSEAACLDLGNLGVRRTAFLIRSLPPATLDRRLSAHQNGPFDDLALDQQTRNWLAEIAQEYSIGNPRDLDNR
jgi:hypothetical protein